MIGAIVLALAWTCGAHVLPDFHATSKDPDVGGVQAKFSVPAVPKHGWDDSGLRLGPPHLAIAWGLPHTTTVMYKDLDVVLASGSWHTLGMHVVGDRLDLLFDGRSICSTSVVGANGGVRLSDVEMKRDGSAQPSPFVSDCVLHRNGIAWHRLSDGTYVARGAFFPGEATYFTGIDPQAPCHF